MSLYSEVDPYEAIEFEYPLRDNSQFSAVEDKFIFCKMCELGYGQWEQLKLSIRKSLIFRFDWFIKSRSSIDLAKRCDQLIKMVEGEMQKKTEEDKSAKKTVSKASKASNSSSGDKKISKSTKSKEKEKKQKKQKPKEKETKSGGTKRPRKASSSVSKDESSEKRGRKKPKNASTP
jgi:hypothetical protein